MHRSLLVFGLVIVCFLSSHAQITSTFDVDTDGWTYFDLNAGALVTPVVHSPSGGNPGGMISHTGTTPVNPNQFWIAPSKFLGPLAARSLGMDLRFDLQQSLSGTYTNTNGDVQLISGSTTLVYDLPSNPATAPSWSSYTIRLDETAGWRVSSTTGTVATRTQVIQVLTNLTALRIRGSFASNTNFSIRLDNVIIEQKPYVVPPDITGFSPTSGEPEITNVVITGANFDATPANNKVYFGAVHATVNSATATELTVTVPKGAQYGPITVINLISGKARQSNTNFNPTFPDGGRIIPSSLDTRIDITLTEDISGLTVADVDGDGFGDLVMASEANTYISVFRHLGGSGDVTASSFAAEVKFATGGSGANGAGLRMIDLDGDGKLDAVTSIGRTAFVGSFATFRNTSTPGNISFDAPEYWDGLSDESPVIGAADIDGDGLPEIMGKEGSSSAVGFPYFWIAQNISTVGNIEFAASRNFDYDQFDSTGEAAIGDLDNDGKPEILVSNTFSAQIDILHNTSVPGAISFNTPFNVPSMAGGVSGITLIDFNEDGKLDVAWKSGDPNDIRIRINTSTAPGTLVATDFATEVILTSALFNYGSTSVGDINGDGKPEILSTDDGDLGIFENTFSGGAFTSSAFITACVYQGVAGSTYPTGARVFDINGDHKPEVIIGITNTTPNRISIYENKNVHAPVISLTTVSPLKGPVGSTVTITGDYFSTVANENIVRFGAVKANVLTATRTQLTVEVPAGATYAPVSVTRDALTAKYHLPFNVIFSTGSPIDVTSFAPPVSIALTGADYDLDVADMDGDNKPDVLIEAANVAHAYRNTYVSGALTSGALTADFTTATNAQNPYLQDLDGDNLPDIASVNSIFQNNSATADISFAAAPSFGGTTNLAFADFNLDGRLDYAGISGTQVDVYENRTRSGLFVGGSFPSVAEVNLTKAGNNGGAAVADFDNDGLFDIVTTNASTNNITLFRNNGGPWITTAMFTNQGNITTLDNPGRVYTADFDVDGKMDFVIYHGTGTVAAQRTVSVFHNQSTTGTLTFTRIDFTHGGTDNATVLGVGDVDGDGRPEIIFVSETSDGFRVFKNNSTPGSVSFSISSLIALADPRAVFVADLNLDKRPELIFSRVNNLSIMENILPAASISFSLQPTDDAVCVGSNATFTASATGDNNLVYQWQIFNGSTYDNLSNNATYSGVTSATLSITGVSAALGGTQYRLLVNGDLTGATSSSTATLLVSTPPAAPTVTGATGCSGSPIVVSASGGADGQYRWYATSSGGTAFSGEVNGTFTSSPSTTTSYFVSVDNGCESARTEVVATITTVAAPGVSGSTGCVGGPVMVSASGGTNGQYRWYTLPSGGTAISGEVNSTYTASPAVTTSYFVSINDGTCESTRVEVIATVTPVFPPEANNIGRCGPGVVTLAAVGTTAGNYRWYDVSTGGAPIAGEVNSTFTTPSLAATQLFYVAINNGSCESIRIPVSAIVNTPPAQPTITSSIPPDDGTVALCGTETVTFTAPAGFSYTWSSGQTTQAITASAPGSYFVTVTDGNGCTSVASNDIDVVLLPSLCNSPPIVSAENFVAPIQGVATLDISQYISDPDNNIDFTSGISVLIQPSSGAVASIVNGQLVIDYTGVAFSGQDQLTLRVCDQFNSCVDAVITIDVIGDITVFNAVSPNNDGLNDYLRLEHIEILESTQQNKVTIYNRWGDVVFEIVNYDNQNRVFTGLNNNGNELASGTYFFKIEFSGQNAPPQKSGYLTLKR